MRTPASRQEGSPRRVPEWWGDGGGVVVMEVGWWRRGEHDGGVMAVVAETEMMARVWCGQCSQYLHT